jgi:2-dehydropantoate 2-reductase
VKIAIIGAGAMGSLFGGYLSRQNDVWLVDTDRNKIEMINAKGVTIQEPEGDRVFHPNAVVDSLDLGPMDLVVVFVKAMNSLEALEKNRHLIGDKTYLMSLQNGAGHEEVLGGFAPPERVILGTTQHNSSMTMPGRIHHGGGGKTSIGLFGADSTVLAPIAEVFRKCGLDTEVSGDIKKQIWKKLFLNASASVLTAILQVKLGYIVENSHAWLLAGRLIEEAVAVAKADGQEFDADQAISDVRAVLFNARDGYTSIYADIRNGVRTEVDTISGSIVRAAHRLGIPVPCHEFALQLIHALEEKPKN